MTAKYLLLLVALCNGVAIENSQVPDIVIPITQIESAKLDLPAPHIKRIKINDHPKSNNVTMVLTWSKVENEDKTDPVIGYKLKMWNVKKIKNLRYEFQDGQQIAIDEEIYPKIQYNVAPDGKLTETFIPANETTTLVEGLTKGATYQYAILAFTKNKEGPLSSATRIRVNQH